MWGQVGSLQNRRKFYALEAGAEGEALEPRQQLPKMPAGGALQGSSQVVLAASEASPHHGGGCPFLALGYWTTLVQHRSKLVLGIDKEWGWGSWPSLVPFE